MYTFTLMNFLKNLNNILWISRIGLLQFLVQNSRKSLHSCCLLNCQKPKYWPYNVVLIWSKIGKKGLFYRVKTFSYQQLSFLTFDMSDTRVRATIISSVSFTILTQNLFWLLRGDVLILNNYLSWEGLRSKNVWTENSLRMFTQLLHSVDWDL